MISCILNCRLSRNTLKLSNREMMVDLRVFVCTVDLVRDKDVSHC